MLHLPFLPPEVEIWVLRFQGMSLLPRQVGEENACQRGRIDTKKALFYAALQTRDPHSPILDTKRRKIPCKSIKIYQKQIYKILI